MNGIKHLPLYFGSLSAIALTLGISSTGAQEMKNHDLCRQGGTYPLEQLGDRDGHGISSGTDSCETVEGVTKGAVWTGFIMWEWDGPKAKEVAGWGIGRKDGATQVCQDLTEKGQSELVIKDGKVTDWAASGQCVITMGTKDWASMVGKTWYWNAKPTGQMTYEIHSEVK
jgi:hypothetical protein